LLISRERPIASPFSQHWSAFASPDRAEVSQLEYFIYSPIVELGGKAFDVHLERVFTL
jgi:hypothetical protein